LAGSLAGACLGILLLATGNIAGAQSPLEPIDTSSPRATLESFLALTDESANRYAAFRENPSPTTQAALRQLTARIVQLFDLSDAPPATRVKVATEAYYLLWDVIARLQLPDPTEIPDESAVAASRDTAEPITRWRFPGTEITITRVAEGDRAGAFLFSRDTVSQAPSFYEAVREMPYLRPMKIQDVYRINQTVTGWMIPPAWVESLPEWTQTLVGGQVLWKWFALLLLLGLALAAGAAAIRWAARGTADATFAALARSLSAPVTIVALVELYWLIALRQIGVTGSAATLPDLLLEVFRGVAVVWIAWTTAHWIAERIIASPRIPTQSLHAHLIRFSARLIGLIAAIALLFIIAQRIGIPVYGLVAGAGVGGVAIALAVRSTLENLVGTLNIYMDRPVQVGDMCRYSNNPLAEGRIEEIGLRSTRIRGTDGTLTTIPNGEFANMHIVNLDRRDRIPINHTIGLRYETTPDQLRYVLAKLREMLLAHPRVAEQGMRVRVTGFGASTLNVQVLAHIWTSIRQEFFEIQEDLILRILEIVDEAGTQFGFPSSTIYQTKDPGLDRARQALAEQRVREWVAANALRSHGFHQHDSQPDVGTASESQPQK
jgi:MscS family membrane protein